MCSPVDLRHRWRDVHSGGNHRLLYIHCFRGLEEDPDRKNVMRTASHPSSHFIYKCKAASLLAKSSPAWHNFLADIVSPWPIKESLALDITTRLHGRVSFYWRSSQAPSALLTCGLWLSRVHLPHLQCQERESLLLLCRWILTCVRIQPVLKGCCKYVLKWSYKKRIMILAPCESPHHFWHFKLM